ncbi:GPI ethanolamine phosphate transferase 1-like [Chrysoperla carnea]|uniref:GPI ethanolamine phosphate transferase 1-like n=1 Tax=Chrysoperla carnea TaxID=189513 RepID=UPI001D08949D|nr:GPI ethanolamine phosphate transferase 1-like [Chrysoperla carnea]
MFKIFLIELTIYLVIFFTILEVYFKTPILNIEEHNVTRLGKAPLGKRVVLIVIDNLSANEIYNVSNDSYSEGVNFIKNVIKTNGTWGTIKPTPQIDKFSGYRSIFFGVKEHPSHKKNYWRYLSSNIHYDSIVNYTEFTYCFGDKQDVFNILSSNKTYTGSKKIPKCIDCIDRDEYVVERIMYKMNHGFHNKSEQLQQKLNADKILFFISLDGSNCIVQKYGPFSNVSKLYLRSLDELLMNIERFFINFYKNDNQTTFILTSNRGLETHSNISDVDTQIPFLAWGAGIKKSNMHISLNQTDTPLLIASLLDISIPKESVGRVPIGCLNVSDKEMAEISFANAKHLLSLFHEHEDKKLRYILKSQELINQIYSGLEYVENYYKPLVRLMLLLILIFWNLLLLEFIVNTNREQSSHRLFAFCDLTPIYTKSKLESDYLEVYRFITIIVILLMINVSFGIVTKTPPRYMVMFALVQFLFVAVVLKTVVWYKYIYKYFKKSFNEQWVYLKNAMIYFICIQFLMADLQHRSLFAITSTGFCLWLIGVTYTFPYNITYLHWILSCFLLTIFPNLPPISSHIDHYYHQFLVLGLILWILAAYLRFFECVMTNRWNGFKIKKAYGTTVQQADGTTVQPTSSERTDNTVAHLQMIIVAIIAAIKMYTYYQKSDCFPSITLVPVFGWSVTAISFLLTLITSLNINYRLISIYHTLLVPVLISSIAYEHIFFLVFIYNLISWNQMEKLEIQNKSTDTEMKTTFHTKEDTVTHLYRKSKNSVYFNDFRRVLFMVSFSKI